MQAAKNIDQQQPPVRLGDRLLEVGLIDADQLDVAVKEQSHSKKPLGKVLVELGFISEAALGEVLAESAGQEFVDLEGMLLDPELMALVPAAIAKRYHIVPISINNNILTVAMEDIFNVMALDRVRAHLGNEYALKAVAASASSIEQVIDQHYGLVSSIEGILHELETGEVDIEAVKNRGEYAHPIVRLVDQLLIEAIKGGVSDIHFEPEGNFLRIRYRIDGVLKLIRSLHKDYWSAICVRIKILCDMNIAETRVPQDGRFNYAVGSRNVDFRVSTEPTIHGENIVMRILDHSSSIVGLDQLGFGAHNESLLRLMLQRPEGIILVTGPTGSGKTTTIYSILNHINDIDRNIMTMEDPVEFSLPLIRQTNINEEAGMTFAAGIRAILRQDPDVIFIGEIRDNETAAMAVRAAMTGHQVYSTLHTNDAPSAFTRLIDIGIKPYLLANNVIGVVSQRLVRKICSHCKVSYDATDQEKSILRIDLPSELTLYRGSGCEYCHGSGQKGRVAITEIIRVDEQLDQLISEGASYAAIKKSARRLGYRTMMEEGADRVKEGNVQLSELAHHVDMTLGLK